MGGMSNKDNRVASNDGLGGRCPYLLVADSTTALCVWNGKRNPKGCGDPLVRFFRIGRGETISGGIEWRAW